MLFYSWSQFGNQTFQRDVLYTAELVTTTVHWLTPLFSLTTGYDCDVNMGCLPLLAVELEDSELWLENFEPT